MSTSSKHGLTRLFDNLKRDVNHSIRNPNLQYALRHISFVDVIFLLLVFVACQIVFCIIGPFLQFICAALILLWIIKNID